MLTAQDDSHAVSSLLDHHYNKSLQFEKKKKTNGITVFYVNDNTEIPMQDILQDTQFGPSWLVSKFIDTK